MKKFVVMMLLLTVAIFAAAGANVKVPIRWKANKASSKVTDFAMLDNKDVCIFVFRIPSLKQYDGKSEMTSSIYFDTDKNLKTGRARLGCEFQINVYLHRKTLQAMTWENDKNTMIRFAKGDYKVEIKGDLLVLTFNRAKLTGVKFNKEYTFRIIPYNVSQTIKGDKDLGSIEL